MKEIVIISGKGGTGKTSISASFAYFGASDVVIADCDVDAADMHLILEPKTIQSEDFYSGLVAKINNDVCTCCGICTGICRFGAISFDVIYAVNNLSCEGCGYCNKVCPVKAIDMREQKVGVWSIGTTRLENVLVHARLEIGAENSGKLVAKVKKEAQYFAIENHKKYVIVDGSPGIGCPVISSLSGADFIVFVTESTVSGFHDLKRLHELVKKYNIMSGCIINKSDLNQKSTDEILNFLKNNGIAHLANLPYDESFTEAMTAGKTIAEYGSISLKTALADSWEQIKYFLK